MSKVAPDTHTRRRYARSLRWILLCIIATLIITGLPGHETTVSAQASTDSGYRDFSYTVPDVRAPTGQKPQSKLWFNDGSWWGILFNKSAEEYHIYRYSWASHTWSDTGTLVDERNNSRADALWDGDQGKLYVASAGTRSANAADSGRFLSFSYDPATKKYSLDQGFPVTVSSSGMEAIVVERDTTGQFWITYTHRSQVYVNHSLDATGSKWGTPFVLPVTGAINLTSDDISAVISFDSKIGVMWGNQNDGAMYFATHADGASDDTWKVQAAVKGPQYADDHINLKSLQADPSGQVFAAVKTSLGDGTTPDPNAPLILLLVRDQNGNWSNNTFGTVADDHTRPIVLIDREHRNLYMFATAPVSGGTIYYKETPLSNISFASGRGTPFIKSSTDPRINNVTSTKQDLNSTTGLLVMAADDSTGYYLHNTMNLKTSDTQAPEATIASGPEGTVNKKTATFEFSANEDGSTFECKLDDGTFESCTSPKEYTGLEDGKHTFTLKATDTAGNNSAPISRTWTVDATAPATPTNFTAKATVDGIALDWANNGETDLAGYNLYHSESGEKGTYAKLNSDLLTNSLYNDTNAPAETTSYYRVTAVDKAGNESNFALESAFRPVPDTEAPATPRSLTATASQDGIALDWADNTETDLAGYNVSRRVEGSTDYTKLNSDLLKDSTYDDAKAPAGKTSYYRVTAVDKAGNESNFAADSAKRPEPPKDTTAPQTTIKSGPSGYTRSRAARFDFSSSESGSTFQCKLDGAGYEKCSSPKVYRDLRDRRHTFYVKATDAAGNVDRSPAVGRWIVDMRAPVIGRISPTGKTRDRTPTIRATVRDIGSELVKSNIRLYVDGRGKRRFSYNQRTDRLVYTQGLSRGLHTVKIIATDKASNRVVRTWRFRVL